MVHSKEKVKHTLWIIQSCYHGLTEGKKQRPFVLMVVCLQDGEVWEERKYMTPAMAGLKWYKYNPRCWFCPMTSAECNLYWHDEELIPFDSEKGHETKFAIKYADCMVDFDMTSLIQ